MIPELKDTEFDIVRPLFSNFEKYQLKTLSVFERNKYGRIFVNDKNNPSSGFCFQEKYFSVLQGLPEMLNSIMV